MPSHGSAGPLDGGRNEVPKTNGYLRLRSYDREMYVYRIVPLERLYELFETGRNVLVSPRKWDDPFENFILRGNQLSRRGLFGQCWTRHRASDAMWRIYSPQSGGVRLRSRVCTLLETLTRSLGSAASSSRPFVGSVRYLPERRLLRFAQKAINQNGLREPSQMAETLLVKRLAFRHEREIRLILCRDHDLNDDLAPYGLDPHKLVDQLMLDPRLTPDEAAGVRDEIRRRTKFRGDIKRSLLDAPPPQLLPQIR
jgi:hypothetical protein